MIEINCSTTDEANAILEAFEIALYAVPDECYPLTFNDISINVNNEPYSEWGSFIDNINALKGLMNDE